MEEEAAAAGVRQEEGGEEFSFFRADLELLSPRDLVLLCFGFFSFFFDLKVSRLSPPRGGSEIAFCSTFLILLFSSFSFSFLFSFFFSFSNSFSFSFSLLKESSMSERKTALILCVRLFLFDFLASESDLLVLT